MSSSAGPISADRFASAITDLPPSNLYAKAAEIRNSIAHLTHSNDQLSPAAEQGDVDCADAIRENMQVIVRMEERLALLRREVERRGYKWDQDGGRPVVENGDATDVNGVDGVDGAGGVAARMNGMQGAATTITTAANATPLSTARMDPADADMLALLHARLRDNDDQEEEPEQGLHL